MHFYWTFLTMAHWIRLSLLCRCKRTRNSKVWYGNVSEQYLSLCKNKTVYCACTRFLCMHKILVHAQHSCACTTLFCLHWRGQGPSPGPKNSSCPGPDPRLLFGWVPALGPGPSSACTRVLCMHKSVVHAQASCACTRILCMHRNLDKRTPMLGRCAASGGFFSGQKDV